MRKKICATIAVLCFIFILSTAGQSDLDLICFNEAVVRVVPATIIMIISSMVGGFI